MPRNRSLTSISLPIVFIVFTTAFFTFCGCSNDMEDQYRLEAYEGLPDNRQFHFSTAPPRHTVEYRRQDLDILEGDESAPTPASQLRSAPSWVIGERLAEGQSLFNVHCSPCHALDGSGYGLVPQRGFPFPPSYHSRRLRHLSLDHFFNVITNGKGKMPAYDASIPPTQRWSVALYVRALQLRQSIPLNELTEREREKLSLPIH